MVIINKYNYFVNDDEFTDIIPEPEICNLKLINDLAEFERLIGLINDIALDLNISTLLSLNTTHGGFIPLNCYKNIKNIYYTCSFDKHYSNIVKNICCLNKPINFVENIHKNINNLLENSSAIIFLQNCKDILSNSFDFNFELLNFNSILITNYLFNDDNNNEYLITNFIKYNLSNSNYTLFISISMHESFKQHFNYYIDTQNILNYDNLINLCIMVKNGGDQFKDMITQNLPFIDKWTILDTGSTDNTINIIKDSLKDKKGQLYEEPFINFRDSRNRLLDLAGNNCKYNIMLDDTYILKGDIRQFMQRIRSDQYADSFSLYIQSNDTQYASNRIVKCSSNLRYLYKIHEVIQEKDNINVIIPITNGYIFDGRFDYMEERTMNRKKLDLQLLSEEIQENPDDPRHYYYMAQTYSLLNEYELAFDYFQQRINHHNQGFIQEKIDAIFEAARLANFKLNKSWDECEKLYLSAYELDKTRPDSIYFIGIHYYLENNRKKAFEYLKLAFEIGYPIHTQYCIKPTLSFYYTPRYLTQLCYEFKEYSLGFTVAEFFLKNNSSDEDYYEVISGWYNIFSKINELNQINPIKFSLSNPNLPLLCFLADGGFNKWSGSSINTQGVGGSETYIIEMARYIQKSGKYDVIVFCNCEKSELFENVTYLPISLYFNFISQHYVNTCIISRYTEYYPATLLCKVENIYLVAHDLTFTCNIIPIDVKLKKIFCLSEWHAKYLSNYIPDIKNYIEPLYYGFNNIFDFEKAEPKIEKIPYKFIYSSFPNRGLLELLTMWPKIFEKQPKCSLHIYSDINGTWVNNVEPLKMDKIRNLLETYNKQPNNYNIFYHGWVNKQTLAESWLSSEFWLYPCTFMETFCLTALESAISKTIPITNNLAALQNTVGNRGIIIEGNAETSEWQEIALNKLFEIIDSTEIKMDIIKKNYKWASNLTWKNQANKLINNYILPNSLEYRGIYNWTCSINTSSNIYLSFLNFLKYFNENNQNLQPKILELGTHTGTSIIYLIRKIPNSLGFAVDSWDNYDKNDKIEETFYNNINISGLSNRIYGIKQSFMDTLINFINSDEVFDIIYIANSNNAFNTYTYCILSWKILKKGGFLIISNYLYNQINNTDQNNNIIDNSISSDYNNDVFKYPFHAVNNFFQEYKEQIKIYEANQNIYIEKI